MRSSGLCLDLPRFLQHFEAVYSRTGRTDAILTAACAHHRLLWIHPFVDGNGRVARMMSHAILLDRLDTGAIRSASRGLARQEREYKEKLHGLRHAAAQHLLKHSTDRSAPDHNLRSRECYA
ncbi:MAG: Fic family protein [Arhodomonas sp.]|nr:Fic family protein [Arhodomonas sp.]